VPQAAPKNPIDAPPRTKKTQSSGFFSKLLEAVPGRRAAGSGWNAVESNVEKRCPG